MTSRQISKKQDPGPGDLPPTAWAVLGLLSFPGERTGYELKKWADASLRFFYWSPAISQIYAELRRLESLGYAASRRSGPEEPRTKRQYAITEAGRAALAEWADSAGDVGPPVLKHPLVLRVWLGHLADPERLRERVEDHIARTRGELKEVRDALARAGGVADWAHPQVALRWSERQHLAELELAEAMLADLDGLGTLGPPGTPSPRRPPGTPSPGRPPLGTPPPGTPPRQGAGGPLTQG
ncbi:PadR family transcriptional regulator [Streptomyces sp. ISL-98]|uniref:PadR family transcriptional regulator n=1 Tax=Streptomyces sp. ISL-98 TaxID=2819192 RepID=UPI001BEA606B|nr:PadR family transcriptional regulator [Streptomyces sp. ISL-98]MBT2508431.1 PadR family transcriptional regulator [Streptomyces sp. ISL-98]